MENKPQTEKQTPFLKRMCNLEFEMCKLRKEIEELKKSVEIIQKVLKNRG